MLRLACFLLLTKSAFAAEAFPVEYGTNGQVGPNTNLVYNFEQIRSDQPPQIELREENINKYRGRSRTTTPVPQITSAVDDGDMSPMHPLPYNAMQWSELQKAPKYVGPVQNWKSVPAPPNFPHWESMTNQAVTNPNNYESQPEVSQQPIVITSEAPAQWSEPKMRSRFRGPSYMPAELTTVPTFAPTMASMLEPEVRHMPRVSSARGRGRQKFDWNDSIVAEPSSTPASAPTPAPSRGPPPAVPTLSPWYDGF